MFRLSRPSPHHALGRSPDRPADPAGPDLGSSSQAGGTPPRPRSGPRMLGNLRVRNRMAAVLAIPLIAATALAGLRVGDALDRADQYDHLHRIAQLSQSGIQLINNLQHERDLLIDPRAQAAGGNGALQSQEERTSGAAAAFQAQAKAMPQSDRLGQHLDAVNAALATLPQVRQQVGSTSPSQLSSDYTRAIMPILGITNELSGDQNQTNGQGWAMYTLALHTAMVWSERALIANASDSGKLTIEQRSALLSSARIQDMTQQEFRLNANAADVAAFQQLLAQPSAQLANQAMSKTIGAPHDTLPDDALPSGWYDGFTAKLNGLNALEDKVGQRLVAQTAQSRHDADRQALSDALVAGLLLIGALALAFLVSRSIVRGLRDLQTRAVEVAEVRLPEEVQALTADGGRDGLPQVTAVSSGTRDEIGAVGRAVDRLHHEAVELAGAQVRLRENVNAIFRNLSHRNQALVQRQLKVIATLEQDEVDPRQLGRLFQLDHLATRMRRNSENLLVLAGADPASRGAAPLALLDTVRAAISEVEQYERITTHRLPDVRITGGAVRDVVHLLAELLENAVAFSSPQTEVTVDGQLLPDGRLMLEICDRGIGMSPAQLTQANANLISGPSLDVQLSESLGLYVVGTLAHRHGIEVLLRAAAPGTSTVVALPAALLETGRVTAGTGHETALEPALRSVLPEVTPQRPGAATAERGPRHAAIPRPQTGGADGPAEAPAGPHDSDAPTGAGVPAGPPPGPLTSPAGTGAEPPTGLTAAAVDRVPEVHVAPAPVQAPALAPAPAPAPENGKPALERRPPRNRATAPEQARPLPTAPAAGDGEEAGALPRRVPRAHLLPGTVEPGDSASSLRAPEQIRSRLNGFQHGTARAADEDGRDD
ncbi:nitrate- and nitrite sensing domain-containing protein [Kitasatospora sp. NPDC101176]|uniref:sensor histidine kinase n=1 Tax=Kitasatospora sp. NPDC101176 TaxID=3364099 RepID=UPI0038067ADA